MKLGLALLALLPHALCAPPSDGVDAWVERVAAKRGLSPDAVRSNMRVETYHGAAEEDAGGQLDRRGPRLTRDYPPLWQAENDNDPVTMRRLDAYNVRCRTHNRPPRNSPYTPNNHVFSFWRASGGSCSGRTVTITCQLPPQFAPGGWDVNAAENTHVTTLACAAGEECWLFKAHSFITERPVTWGGCVRELPTDPPFQEHGVWKYQHIHSCPIPPASNHHWDISAETLDGLEVQWTVFRGTEESPTASVRAPRLLFYNTVEWRGNSPQARPTLKFERTGRPAAIRMYSLVT